MDAEKTNAFFFRFEDLRIYHKALDYVRWVKQTVNEVYPDHEKKELGSQFMRAAQSIPVNIAEGSGRNKSQFIYYLKMAKSSVRECLVYTTISQSLGYLDDSAEEASRNELIEMTKMIGALISSLQKGPRHSDDRDSGGHKNVQPQFDEDDI